MAMFGAYTQAELKKRMTPEDKAVWGTRPIARATWKHVLFSGHHLLFFKPGVFARFRVLDGYLGLVGVVCHYRLMAVYFSFLVVVSLSLSAWGRPVFAFEINYRPFERQRRSWEFAVRLFGGRYTTDNLPHLLRSTPDPEGGYLPW